MSSPLFRNAQKALEEAAKREEAFRSMVDALRTLRGTSRPVMRNVKRLMKSTSGLDPAQRYGKVSDFVRDQIIGEVIRQLGPLGPVFQALINIGRGQQQSGDSIQQDIDEAAQLLQHLIGPPDRPAWMKQKTGQPSTPETPQRITPQPTGRKVPTQKPKFQPSGTVQREAMGRRYTFRANDPIVTGEMIDVISSNVHSIGYEWNFENPTKGTLFVRFLEKGGRKTKTRAAGPEYAYFGVHPEVFMAFQKAASKGRFVWDRLRVRGTVSGHRFHYDLADTGPTGYIPRKATRMGPNEYYLQREHQGGTSQLDDEFVQRVGTDRKGPQSFVPNRARPNRGTPNRGQPNRGR